jgi:hypothetical protein
MMGKKSNPAGSQTWVWDHGTHARKPMGFFKPGPNIIATYISPKI